MADKKISALTGATTPLAGTEVLPIVQGGSTVKVSIANVTAGRAISTGPLSVATADITLDNAYSLKGKLVAGTAVPMVRRNSSDEVAIDEDGYGTKIGFGGRFGFAGNGNFTIGLGNVVIGTSGKGIDFSATGEAGGMTSELLADYEEGTWTPTQGSGLTVVGAFSSSGKYTRIGRIITLSGRVQGGTSVAVIAGGIITNAVPFQAIGTGTGNAVNSATTASALTILYGSSFNLYSVQAVVATTFIDFTITYTV